MQFVVFVCLEGCHQLRLHPSRQTVDFIEKEDAVFCLLDEANFIGGGTGKSTFFVTKKLRFGHGIISKRGTVDRDEIVLFFLLDC